MDKQLLPKASFQRLFLSEKRIAWSEPLASGGEGRAELDPKAESPQFLKARKATIGRVSVGKRDCHGERRCLRVVAKRLSWGEPRRISYCPCSEAGEGHFAGNLWVRMGLFSRKPAELSEPLNATRNAYLANLS